MRAIASTGGRMHTNQRAACLALLVAAGCSRAPAPPADAIYVNGRIYTLAGAIPSRVENEPVVEAIAIRHGRIVAAGTTAEVQAHAGKTASVHDLAGRCVVPGFVDAHAHMSSLGRSLREVDLVGTTSYDSVVARIVRRAAELPAGSWIMGRGWDQNDWPIQAFPDHAALSAAVPEHPVYVRRVDGHAALVNARALQAAQIGRTTADPAGGRIVRRPDGEPTGVLVDAAKDLVTRHIPSSDATERRARLRAALSHCAAQGLTGIHDAGIGPFEVDDYRAFLAAGELPLRIWAMHDATPDAEERSSLGPEVVPAPFDTTLHLALAAVKFMVDGALGSRGAALLEDYADAPGERGLPQTTPEAFLQLAAPLHARGFQLATHAIGDAANRMVLDTYERLQRDLPRPDARHRIEHAQILATSDIARFARLGVLPSMQPTHCTSDMPWAGARLGPERLRGAYAWRSLRATGVVIPCGSDAPVESVAPLLGIFAAVTRRGLDGEPAGGWSPEECLTRSEAVRGFTVWPAYASFTEKVLGTLEVGKWADFVVLDRDVMQVRAADIPSLRVLETVVGGATIFSAP
jgi:hypothetical protein